MATDAIFRYKGKPKSDSWVRWIVTRTMKKNQSNLIAVVGKTGSGKTWSAMSICEKISKLSGVPFGLDNIVFSLRELMELINSDKLQKGSCIIFDEPQVSISARDFQSEANKVFNFLVTTFRHRNFNLFFCSPFESLLDRTTRRLFLVKFQTQGINFRNGTCRILPKYLEYADNKEEPYRKGMIICFKSNGVNKSEKLVYWDVPKPSKELVKQYEAKKLAFTTRLNINIMNRLQKYDDSGKSITAEVRPTKRELDERKPLTEKQLRTMRVFANVKEQNKYKIASKMLGIDRRTIRDHLELAKNKGYTLGEFRILVQSPTETYLK